MELGQKLGSSMGLGNRRVVSAWHWQAFNDYAIQDRYLDVEYPLDESFHTYKLIWQPDYMSTYVDDQLIGTISLAACETSWDCPEFHQHHFLILNLAVGGEFTCCEYGFALENEPHGTTWTMEVDYVRIYGNEHTDLVAPTSAEQNAEETPTFTLVETPMPTSLPTTLSPTSIPSDLLSEKPTLNPTLSVKAPTSGPTPDVQMDTEPRTSSPVAAPSNAEVPSNEPTLDVASFLNAVDGDSNATSNSPTFDAGTPTISSPTQQPQLSEIVAAEDDGRSSLPDYLKEEESGSVSAWSLLRLLGISTACLLVVYLLLQAS